MKHERLRESLNAVVNALQTNNLSKTTIDYGFSWSGDDNPELYNGFLNTKGDRTDAAKALADYVVKHHVKGEPITLLGYSHGGNVSIQAIPLIREKLGKDVQINLVTLFTPCYNFKNDKENPATISSMINKNYHFWSSKDGIVPLTSLTSASKRYKKSK